MSSKKERERRRFSRASLKTEVFFEAQGKKWKGTILNFSEIGMLIQASHILRPGEQLTIPLLLSSGEKSELRGTVVWSQDLPLQIENPDLSGYMGIELSTVPNEYLKGVADARNRSSIGHGRSFEERYEVFHKVRFQSGDNFLTEYVENINHGGMYIVTDAALQKGTFIRADIEIPGFDEPIELKGRVAYCLDKETAKERGRRPGVGVQFVDLSPEVKNQIHHYIQRLSIHRSTPQKFQSKDIPSKGSLSDFLIPEILIFLSETKQTGVLQLDRKGVQKEIFFRKGFPIFVSSSLPSENLGSYLTRRGLLPLAEMSKWLPLMELSDFQLVKMLSKSGVIEQTMVTNSLVENQEEKITNTFPWFDGKFEFKKELEWPSTIFMLPLQPSRIIFSGVLQWYNEGLISSWMGLDEKCVVRRLRMPSPEEAPLPSSAYQILFELWSPQTLQALGKSLGIQKEVLFPSIYALVISKWITLEFSLENKTSEHSSSLESPPIKEKEDLLMQWKKLVEEDYSRFKNLNYFELLEVDPMAPPEALEASFQKRLAQYSMDLINEKHVKDGELFQKVSEITSWLRTAFETLMDSNLRKAYEKQLSSSVDKEKQESIEMEHALLISMSHIQEEEPTKALEVLKPLMSSPIFHPTISGWYGWALFKVNSNQNHSEALEWIEKAIKGDPSDPQLYFFQGEIFAFLSNWPKAELAFLQAVRLQPNFEQAKKSLLEARTHIFA